MNKPTDFDIILAPEVQEERRKEQLEGEAPAGPNRHERRAKESRMRRKRRAKVKRKAPRKEKADA